ncbi:T9SS C-terminal target domain-containing protein [Rhodocytophaga rosea]|uniref:T9SS C-terminal target domain-containing protein n=1 Tax=Rhodocytophaga rosea TaxID=2704465 RepID=A0A6C0GD21_9BACT|nr:T9SS C-terminal target domain-containing protein [Rhodocytophaga rosea]QHT65876.1 T9SS C-terminal target domain-containing protein [Rhodocytophaga rosea]
MKNVSKLLSMLFLGLILWSCNKDDDGGEPDITDPANREVVEVSGSIIEATTWEEGKKYLLKGFVYVDKGATLTIQPGTIIKGDKDSKGSLIIKPGSRIVAEGTQQKPIVFTSNQPKGSRAAGDWGGLIILGNAIVNKSPSVLEGEGTSTFGGTNNADNSGVLKYVRIEFAGIAYETDKEINALTLGGVGSGTTIDFVQSSYSGDDAFEWFGGAVNAKHLVSFRTLDDDFDTDLGYSGNVQYGVILRDPAVADQCTCSDSNGFESDNDGLGTTAAPQTTAKFANISLFVGPGTLNSKYRSAARIRRNSAISIYNSVFTGGHPKAGLELEGSATQDNFTVGTSDYAGMILSGFTTPVLPNADPVLARLKDVTRANNTELAAGDLKLDADYNNLTAPKFLPQSGSPLLSAGVTLPAGFETAAFKGAFNTSDWTEGWTNFDPQNAEY